MRHLDSSTLSELFGWTTSNNEMPMIFKDKIIKVDQYEEMGFLNINELLRWQRYFSKLSNFVQNRKETIFSIVYSFIQSIVTNTKFV